MFEMLRSSIQGYDDEALLALSGVCGNDLIELKSSMAKFDGILSTVASNVDEVIEVTSCHTISPIIRRITHGAFCKESAKGMTTVWSCLFAISTLAFVMLTTRAAVFNSVRTRRKRNTKRRKLRPEKVEKEFEEYKAFMSEYYDDTDHWIMRPVKKAVGGVIEIDLAKGHDFSIFYLVGLFNSIHVVQPNCNDIHTSSALWIQHGLPG